jgi:hypothetical protein
VVGDDGASVGFSGNAGVAGMVAAVLDPGRAAAYSLAVGAGETPATVAQALAALAVTGGDGVPAREAWAEGATLMLPGASGLVARVAAARRERKEVERFRQGLQVIAWTGTTALRDGLAVLVHRMVREARSLLLPDGTSAFLTYTGTAYDDAQRQQPLYRRDLLLDAEFPSVAERVSPPVLVPRAGVVALPVGAWVPPGPPPPESPIRRVIVV